MSVLASKRGGLDSTTEFSKELYTKVSDNLKIFSIEEWASDLRTLEYKEVLIAVYVRTDRENLVLLLSKDKFSHIFKVPTFISNGGLYPNILTDSGLVCGKNFVDFAFSFKSREAMERFVANSTCFPVGAIETVSNYVLVFNVIVADSLLTSPDISLKQGFHFCPIDTLSMTDSLQKEISKSLVLVKSEDKK